MSFNNQPVPQGVNHNPQYGMESSRESDGNQFDWMMDQLMEGQGEGGAGPGEGGAGQGDHLLHMILEEDEGEHGRNKGK